MGLADTWEDPSIEQKAKYARCGRILIFNKDRSAIDMVLADPERAKALTKFDYITDGSDYYRMTRKGRISLRRDVLNMKPGDGRVACSIGGDPKDFRIGKGVEEGTSRLPKVNLETASREPSHMGFFLPNKFVELLNFFKRRKPSVHEALSFIDVERTPENIHPEEINLYYDERDAQHLKHDVQVHVRKAIIRFFDYSGKVNFRSFNSTMQPGQIKASSADLDRALARPIPKKEVRMVSPPPPPSQPPVSPPAFEEKPTAIKDLKPEPDTLGGDALNPDLSKVPLKNLVAELMRRKATIDETLSSLRETIGP